MNNEQPLVGIDEVHHLDKPITDATANHLPFFISLVQPLQPPYFELKHLDARDA